jgi:hypothetical protein
MLMEVFELRPLHSLLDYKFLQDFFFIDQGLELWVARGTHSDFALRTIQVIENNTRSIILFLNKFFYAFEMIDMAASKVDTWSLSKTGAVANITEIFFVSFRFFIIWHFINTFLF